VTNPFPPLSPERETLELLKLSTEIRKLEIEKRKAEAEAAEKEHSAALMAIELAKAQREESAVAMSDDSNFTYTFDQGVHDDSVSELLETTARWDRTDPASEWTIYLNSPGGYTDSGSHLVDQLMGYSERGGGGHHITIAVRGTAASMAGIILQAADTRLMGRHSLLMIHQPSWSTRGPVESMKDDISCLDAWSDLVVDLFVERSNGRTSKKKFEKMWDRRDVWLPPKKALSYGFIDGIG